MAPEEPRSGRREINLADPGGVPPAPRSLRWVFVVLAVMLVAGAAAGGFLLRQPIAGGLRTVGGWTGDAAGSVWDQWSDWGTSLQDRAAAIPEPPPPTTVPPVEPVASRSVLLTVGDGVGAAAFALMVQPPVGDRELVMIPQTLLVQVPGFGEFSMAESLAFGGPALARLALANEMGIRIDDLVAVPTGGLTALAEDLVVDVPVELFVEEPDGSRRLIASGTQRLSIDLVELLLVEQGTGDQFDWLRRQEAVWEGIGALVVEDPGAAVRLMATAADPTGSAGLLTAIAADPLIGTPPLDRVAMGGSREALVLATDRIDGYLEEHLGHLHLREGRRPRVEILNGNGMAGSTLQAAEALIAEGFYVFRSGNADRFDYAASQVIAQGEDAVEAAREVGAILGVADLLLEARAPSGVVDVSIIVGTDLARREG